MKINGTPDKDIFKANPDLCYLETGIMAIARFGKPKASKILWALYLIYFPDNRILFQMPISERMATVNKNYLQEDIDWEEHTDLISLFKKEVMSRGRRALLTYTEIFDKIADESANMDLTSPNQRKHAQSTILNFPDLRKALHEETQVFEQDLEQEEEADVSKIHGNASISRREQRHS